MNCEKIQEWLMTDYLDNELDSQRSLEAENHLKECSVCREFLEAVRKVAVAPLKDAKPLQPDAIVWQRIQEKIQAEKERSMGWFEKLADVLMPVLKPSQPVFRVAFVALLIIGIVILTSWPSRYSDPAYAYIEEQATFLNELRTGNPNLLNNDLADYDAAFNEIQA